MASLPGLLAGWQLLVQLVVCLLLSAAVGEWRAEMKGEEQKEGEGRKEGQ